MRRPPTEIPGDPQCFDRNFVEKQFRGRGAPIDDLGPLFLKSRNPKFLSTRKKRVFCVAVFFESATKTTVLFFRGAPIFRQQNCINLPGFRFKNERQ